MTYDIARREVPDQAIVSIRERMAVPDLPRFIGRAFGELVGHLRLLGVAPISEPFIIYHEFGADGIDAEACMPFKGDVAASGRITARVLPGSVMAETLHVGPYDEVVGAYEALTEWIERHGFEAVGPVRETYLDGPDVPPSACRTIIDMPIAEAAVPVG